MKQLTFNKKDIGIHMIFFLMMFHGVLEEYSNIFKYVDELFTVAIFILGIFYLFFYSVLTHTYAKAEKKTKVKNQR